MQHFQQARDEKHDGQEAHPRLARAPPQVPEEHRHGDRPERNTRVQDRVQDGEIRAWRGKDRSARDGSYTESNEEVAAGMQLRRFNVHSHLPGA